MFTKWSLTENGMAMNGNRCSSTQSVAHRDLDSNQGSHSSKPSGLTILSYALPSDRSRTLSMGCICRCSRLSPTVYCLLSPHIDIWWTYRIVNKTTAGTKCFDFLHSCLHFPDGQCENCGRKQGNVGGQQAQLYLVGGHWVISGSSPQNPLNGPEQCMSLV